MLERHPLRAYDAIHLATALTVNRRSLTFGAVGLVFLSARPFGPSFKPLSWREWPWITLTSTHKGMARA